MESVLGDMNGALSLWKSEGQNVDFTADNSLPLNAVI